MDNVSFDRTQRFVSDNHKDLLLFLQADEVPKPRLLSQPGGHKSDTVRAKTQSHKKQEYTGAYEKNLLRAGFWC